MKKTTILIITLSMVYQARMGVIDFTTDAKISSSLTTSSIKIIQNLETDAKLVLENSEGKTEIVNNRETLTFKQNGKPSLQISPIGLKAKEGTRFSGGLNINKELVVNNKRQWLLAHSTDFKFYEKKFRQKCGAFNIIGGYCISSKDDIPYVLDLPDHSFVRIVLNFHFIDSWQGETGYIKVSHFQLF